MPYALNDVHSQLNLTQVADVVRPSSVQELQAVVRLARQRGLKISVAGGRHAMGGQQFKAGALHIDMTALTHVLASDATLGHITLQAGAMWPAIQLSTYIPRYAEFLESARENVTAPRPKESLVIGEQYVPQDRLLEFINGAREILRRHKAELIYGTIRAISQDTVSALPWARDDFACVIFNLRTVHTIVDIEKTATTFRALNDLCIALSGSFFLTYHRYATAEQVLACYPNFETWLERKNHYDPDMLFDSDWHQHYRNAMLTHATTQAAAMLAQSA